MLLKLFAFALPGTAEDWACYLQVVNDIDGDFVVVNETWLQRRTAKRTREDVLWVLMMLAAAELLETWLAEGVTAEESPRLGEDIIADGALQPARDCSQEVTYQSFLLLHGKCTSLLLRIPLLVYKSISVNDSYLCIC